ncbi:MAG: prolyl oligopeptidase family serine peptidase [Pseudomonadota bacterium]
MQSTPQRAGALLLALAACASAHAQKSVAPADPYRWLEEVTADKSLAWVKEHNAVSQKEIEGRAQFGAIHARLKTILNSRERIPYVAREGEHLYNFWRDAQHVRGIWRRTTLAQYQLPEPAWETVIDVDQLARDEKENWVWSGVSCLEPKGERCMVSLSRGGGDAHVVREFDTAARAFVKDGFALPEAKGSASFIDQDTVFVETDFGAGSMTTSGYPRIVKEWKRGTALAQARVVYEGKNDDLSISAYKDFTPGFEHQFVERGITFYTNELYVREGERLVKIAKPDDANAYTVRDQLMIDLRSDWKPQDKTYPQGALLAIDFKRFMQGARDFELLFTPTPTTSLEGVAVTKSGLLLNELASVKNRIVELKHVDGKWQRRAVAAPAFGTLGVTALDPARSDQYFLTVTDFLTPTTLYLGSIGSDERRILKSLPAYFDAAPYTVTQHEATSKDGTRVPYFVVMAKDTKLDGNNPTVLYGYGGFEVSMKPSYSGVMGESWLKNGGVYVLANIRGGGEFGPRWHQAALKEKRQHAYDDFIAVAEDLTARKISSARHLGIMGGSNGGLLVGAVMVQRPDLFNAVVCQVPLLDMRRYNQLLAGASWMGEYGNPDEPKEWEFISKYSPYQNVSKDKHYPRVLFTTSTRDDRVHPGHARKMVALMQSQGHDVLYWENTEGGHAGAANNDQQAQMWAMTYTYLLNQLK